MVEQQVTGTGFTAAHMNGTLYEPNEETQDEETGFRHEVAALLHCPVCHELATDPRQLNCGHFQCSSCVDLLLVDEVVRCGKCSYATPMTKHGVRQDELVVSLLELLAKFRPQNRQEKGRHIDEHSPDVTSMVNGNSGHMNDDGKQLLNEEGTTLGSSEEVSVNINATPAIVIDEVQRPDTEIENQVSSGPTEPVEVILEPPANYQSPTPSPPPSIADTNGTERKLMEHDITESETKMENMDGPGAEGNDEPDSKMKVSEIKPTDVAMSLEMERQCGDCHSTQCTCNINTLLTPPASNGSQLSVETNTSSNAVEDDIPEILVKQFTKFPVTESASHLEVANSNKIYVTRWTYNESGTICTFDINGKKTKFVHCGHHNYTGVTLSKLGFIFALNTSKKRVEEYSGADGKKVRQFKLDMCRDPQAVDIMPTGEVLVVDQDRNRVIIYPNNKKGSSKPRILTHELIKAPYDIATSPEGFYLTSPGKHSLLKMDLEGNLLWSYNGRTSDIKKPLRVPQGVCTDETGHAYVVDRENDSILVFTKDGELKGRISEKDKSFENMNPWYVSVKDGIMAVLFKHNVIRTYRFE